MSAEIGDQIDDAIRRIEDAVADLRRLRQIEKAVEMFAADPNATWDMVIGGVAYTCGPIRLSDTPTHGA